MAKRPLLAGFLNLILPGLGYVYAGKRVVFGAGLLIWSLVMGYYGLTAEIPTIMWVDSAVLGILFAYDGYKTAEEVS